MHGKTNNPAFTQKSILGLFFVSAAMLSHAYHAVCSFSFPYWKMNHSHITTQRKDNVHQQASNYSKNLEALDCVSMMSTDTWSNSYFPRLDKRNFSKIRLPPGFISWWTSRPENPVLFLKLQSMKSEITTWCAKAWMSQVMVVPDSLKIRTHDLYVFSHTR